MTDFISIFFSVLLCHCKTWPDLWQDVTTYMYHALLSLDCARCQISQSVDRVMCFSQYALCQYRYITILCAQAGSNISLMMYSVIGNEPLMLS